MPHWLLMALIGSGATGPSFPAIPAPTHPLSDVRAAAREDAAILAVRFVDEAGGEAAGEVRLPEGLLDSLANAVGRVHGLRHPARDAVFEQYRIRAYPHQATHEVIVAVGARVPWRDAWRRGEALTGDTEADSLVTTYRLRIQSYRESGTGAYAVLRSEDPLHVPALARRFGRVRGVRFAEPNGHPGDGDDIRASAHAGGWRLDFSVGFGDCPAGCTGRHTWSFEVSTDGRVDFRGESGDPAPAPRAPAP